MLLSRYSSQVLSLYDQVMQDEVSETENIRKNLAIERMIVEGCDILLDVNQTFVRQGIQPLHLLNLATCLLYNVMVALRGCRAVKFDSCNNLLSLFLYLLVNMLNFLLLLQVICLPAGRNVKQLHSSRCCAFSLSFQYPFSIIQSMSFCLGLPLPLFPSILPSIISLCRVAS